MRGSSIGFFNLVIPTQNFVHDSVIPMVIFGIPLLVHTFNPESCPDFALNFPNPEKLIGDPQITFE